MLYTPHFLVGAAIVNTVPNPFISFPLALLSHIVLDKIPHNDFDLKPGFTIKAMMNYDIKHKMFILGGLTMDGLLLISSAIFLFMKYTHPWMILAGGVLGTLPDLIQHILLLFGVPLHDFQQKWQWQIGRKWGFVTYPIVCLLALAFL